MQGYQAQRNATASEPPALAETDGITKTPVRVYLGMNGLDGDIPAYAIPFDEPDKRYSCYLTREIAERYDLDPAYPDIGPWLAEWNGISFDLLEPLIDETHGPDRRDAETPF